jgi:hypothetical protein
MTGRHWSRSLAALGALAAVLLVASPVFAVDGVIEINQARAAAGNVTAGDGPGFPVSISASGSYRLTSNLITTPGLDGIDVTASHVTLDLNGFTITCGGVGLADGISIQAATNVEVRNGTIIGFPRDGIFTNGTTNYVRVIGVRAIGNATFGIDLEGFGGVIDGCTTLDSNTGMRVVDNSRVVNSIANGNTSFALVLGGPSGYGGNVFTGNNGGNVNPQVSGGFQLGTNICGSDTVCP